MLIFDKKTATRRAILMRAVAAGAVASVGPWFVRDARSSSGELNWFTWEDYAPKPLMDKFTKDTGIKINVTLFDSNETQLNKLRAARGEGFDMCTPTVTWVGAHVDAGNLQPVDWAQIKTMGNMAKTFHKLPDEMGAIKEGKYYCMPYKWGTEALGLNIDAVKTEYGKASFGDLWDPAYKGKMTCRPRSIMLGTGLWMEGKGDMPAGMMVKSYDDQPTMEKYYGQALEYAIKNKAQIAKFWTGTNDTIVAYRQEGCVIGQTWDGPINQMRNDGDKVKYLAPKEGALTWCDTLAIPKGAKNIEQAYAYMNWALQPEVGGLMANETGYNSIVVGAEKFTNPNYQRNFTEAYPGDAIEKLWFQREEKPWFIAKRQEFAAKLQAA